LKKGLKINSKSPEINGAITNKTLINKYMNLPFMSRAKSFDEVQQIINSINPNRQKKAVLIKEKFLSRMLKND
jgi:hypothetical protein